MLPKWRSDAEDNHVDSPHLLMPCPMGYGGGILILDGTRYKCDIPVPATSLDGGSYARAELCCYPSRMLLQAGNSDNKNLDFLIDNWLFSCTKIIGNRDVKWP